MTGARVRKDGGVGVVVWGGAGGVDFREEGLHKSRPEAESNSKGRTERQRRSSWPRSHRRPAHRTVVYDSSFIWNPSRCCGERGRGRCGFIGHEAGVSGKEMKAGPFPPDW